MARWISLDRVWKCHKISLWETVPRLRDTGNKVLREESSRKWYSRGLREYLPNSSLDNTGQVTTRKVFKFSIMSVEKNLRVTRICHVWRFNLIGGQFEKFFDKTLHWIDGTKSWIFKTAVSPFWLDRYRLKLISKPLTLGRTTRWERGSSIDLRTPTIQIEIFLQFPPLR